MYIFTPNMKFLCLTMWLGGLYTDNDDDANTDANNDVGRLTKYDCTGSSVFMPNKQIKRTYLNLHFHK